MTIKLTITQIIIILKHEEKYSNATGHRGIVSGGTQPGGTVGVRNDSYRKGIIQPSTIKLQPLHKLPQ
jgi:hypothetical protein